MLNFYKGIIATLIAGGTLVVAPSIRAGSTINISISPSSATVAVSQTLQFTAKVTPASNSSVTWSVNGILGGNTTIGTISKSGLYTAPAALPSSPAVTVAATSVSDPTKSAKAIVTLTSSTVSVSVSPSSASVALSRTQQFTATVTGSSNTAVTWSVNGVIGGNSTVGTISAGGLYTAPSTIPSTSSVTVAATSSADPSKSAQAIVTIVAPTSLTVSPSSATVPTSQSVQFAVGSTNAGGGSVKYTWSVNGVKGGNSTAGTISSQGVYTAPAVPPSPATATITVTSSTSQSGQASATVVPMVSVALSPTTASVKVSQTQQFTATVGGTTNTAVIWSVNGVAGGNSTVGTVSTSGLYTGPSVVPAGGSVTVAATSVADTTKSAQANVAITPAVSVTLSPTSASVQVTKTQQFTATVSGATNTTVSWSVNGLAGGNSTVGTVSASGLYTAPLAVPSGGSVTVTATSAADTTKSAQATVTITPAVSVTLSPTSASVVVSNTQQFTATVSGATNTAVSWSVNGIAGGNSTAGTVSTSGLYTAPSAVPTGGSVTVAATSAADSTKIASAAVTVLPLISVGLSPTLATVQVSQPQQFTATVSGATNTAVSWSVNGVAGGNSTVGTVSTNGLYTAPSVVPSGGSVTVTATSAADTMKSAGATVTVIATTLSITTTSITSGTVGVAYNATLAATGGASPYTWSVTSGTLPGVTLSTAGALSGTPTTSGAYTFGIQVVDSIGFTASQSYNLTISPATHSVSLNWTASISPNVVGCNVYRATQSGGPYTQYSPSLIIGTTYTDIAVQAGQTYYYVVTAVDNNNNESIYSNETQAVVPSP